MEFFGEAGEDGSDFLFDLELDGVDVVFDGVEVLLLLLLPLQQSLHTLHAHHLPVDQAYCTFLSLETAAEFLDAFSEFQDRKFVAIVFLSVAVAVAALLAEQRPTLAPSLGAKVDEKGLGVLGAAQGQTAGQGIFKHLYNAG